MSAPESLPASRVMLAVRRARVADTVVLRDSLPPLEDGEIRLGVDAVGLSSNNLFYAQMGDAPVFRFYAVYPLPAHKELANVPAWGVGTVIASLHFGHFTRRPAYFSGTANLA